MQLHQKSTGAARIVVDVADGGVRDKVIEAIKNAVKPE
jgi:RNA-binding protein YhbY